MRNSFRQGVISYQKDGNGAPQYLLPSQTSGFVTLNVAPTPTVVTFAHGTADYLQTFDTTQATAWAVTPNTTTYLYWDLDLLTGNVSNGSTAIEPFVSSLEPQNPANDQHWFDLNTNKMKVWSTVGGKWLDKVRVFAGKVLNGNTNQIQPRYVGSQVGLDVEANPGYLMLDSQLRPLRTSDGQLLTTDTRVRIKTTAGTSGVLATPPNAFIPVRAAENIPAMSLVYFSSEDTVSLASSDPALLGIRTPVGIVQEALAANEIGTITQTGDITYDQWDWSAVVGQALYSNSVGQLTATRPAGLMAYRVGFVKNRNTIVFNVDAETQPQVYSASPAAVIVAGTTPINAEETTNQIGERVVTISIDSATEQAAGSMSAQQVQTLVNVNVRMAEAEAAIEDLEQEKADVVHTHVAADITDLQPLLDEKMDADTLFDDRYSLLGHNHDDRYSLLGHTHIIAEVTNLQNTLDDKAPLIHTHVIDDVNGLQSALDGKANSVHTHAINDITNLQSTLDGKAAIDHTHAIADVTGLQSALDTKADAQHTHTMSQITDLQPALDAKADVDHTHVVADITDLQPLLDAKMPADRQFALYELTDVELIDPAPEMFLKYDGQKWIASDLPDNGGGGGDFNLGEHSINELQDVDTSTYAPNFGDVLTWNGGFWYPQAPTVPQVPILTNSTVTVGATSSPIFEDQLFQDSARTYEVQILGRDLNNGDVYSYRVFATAKRVGSDDVALVGLPASQVNVDNGVSFLVTLQTGPDYFQILAVGEAGRTVAWNSTVVVNG